MYKCPNCGSEGHFDIYVNDPIWTINCEGYTISTHIYNPDDYDSAECQSCGYVADLCDFDYRNFDNEE